MQTAQGRAFQIEVPTNTKTGRLKYIGSLAGILYAFVVDLIALFKNNLLIYLSPIIHYTLQRSRVY